MRYVCLLAAFAPLLAAQNGPANDGASIYKQHCGSCHDAPQGRVPSLGAIKQMTPEAIYGALSTGAMKSQAEGLSIGEVFQLIGYIAPTPAGADKTSFEKTCTSVAPLKIDPASSWGGWSPDVANTRFQDSKSAGLGASDLPKLKLKWAFNLGNVTIARGQPAVAGGRVFFGTTSGDVYSIDAATGCTYWGFKAVTSVRGGIAIGSANGVPVIFFGDGSATMYALNASTGELIWKNRPVEHMWATATATPQFYKGVLYEGFSSVEEAIAADPRSPCCTFRGSVVALDAATGKTIWQSYSISETAKAGSEPAKPAVAGKQQGPSGAGIWATPTIDEKLGALYVATGDNYSAPATDTSDAILAFDLKTGKRLWSRQLAQGDTYNVGCSTPQKTNCTDFDGPDFDFGQPPILVELGGGKRALVIGQKSGMVHAIDPDANGKILWQTRAGEGGKLGGSQWGSAADRRNIYVAISDADFTGVADANAPGGFRIGFNPKKGGGLYAIDLKSGKVAWTAKPAACPEVQAICSPAQSAAVTAIPGAVFSGSLDGHMRAFSSEDGHILWHFDTAVEFPTVNGKPAHGGSIDATGAAIVGGTVFVNSGYNQYGGMPGNVLLAFSVNGQ